MNWLSALLRRTKHERELKAELQFHVDEQIKANLAAGMSSADARRHATLEFGGLEHIKEDCRDVRPAVWVEQTLQDLRYACRQLAKAPGFTAVAIFTLALGIGATTAIFSVVNSVLFKPLAYQDSERLVNVRETRMPQVPVLPFSAGDFRDVLAASSDVFESIYLERTGGMDLTGAGDPIGVRVDYATHPIFSTLRIEPLFGRVLNAGDELPGNNRVVVLNYGLWQQQFGGRREILGETIRLNDEPYTVVGVLRPELARAFTKDLITPLVLTDKEWADRSSHQLSVFARLKPGATVEQAQARLSVVGERLAQAYPGTNKPIGISAVSILENRTSSTRALLFTIGGAVSLLLLIACTNVANLLLARALAREREISLRAALGASRVRIVRQLLVESVVLAFTGAAFGLAVAKGGLQLLLTYAPPTLPRANAEIELDGRAVLVTIVVAIVTGLAFGLVPALQGTRIDLSRAMKQGGGGGVGGHRNFTRHALVIAAIALAVVLLNGAGLMIRSFAQVAQFDSGINPRGVTVVRVAAANRKYSTPEKRIAFSDAVLERYRALTGNGTVAVTTILPSIGGDIRMPIQVEGNPTAPGEAPVTAYAAVTPDYFQALGIRLERGRLFSPADRLGATPVVVLGQSAAAQLFPNVDPLGRRIAFATDPQTWREIVGIVSDVRPYELDREPLPQTYAPFAQLPMGTMNFLLRPGALSRAPSANALAHEIYAVNPEQPVAGIVAFDELVARAFSQQRFAMMLFTVFSVIALILGTIGIYGVMAFSVARRTAEFGVRIALGAGAGDVMRMIFGQAARLVAAGLGVGIFAALGAGRFVQSLLYRTSASDPFVLAAIAVLLLVAALLAALIPAMRATRVDPMIALRTD